MSDIEFIQLGREVLREMRVENMSSQECNILIDKMQRLKIYMIKNSKSKLTNDFIDEFLNCYLELFFSEELIKAFNIQEPFFRQIQIYRNLPSTTHLNYPTFLFETLSLTSFPHFYLGFQEVLEEHRKELLAHPHIQQVLEFAKTNPSLLKGSIDKYGTIEEEQNLYYKASKGYYFQELQDFANSIGVMGQDEARSGFMHKRIGNIGELYTFSLISNQPYKLLAARDIKNGLGYDIYYRDINNHENLVEVKTTTRMDSDEDSFEISENEYGTMKQCFDNPQTNYIICRVTLNRQLNPSSYTLLVMLNNTTLIDISNRNRQYKLYPFIGPKIHFQRYTPKVKVLT